MTPSERGRLGGLATAAKHGREHMAAIGRKGFKGLVKRCAYWLCTKTSDLAGCRGVDSSDLAISEFARGRKSNNFVRIHTPVSLIDPESSRTRLISRINVQRRAYSRRRALDMLNSRGRIVTRYGIARYGIARYPAALEDAAWQEACV